MRSICEKLDRFVPKMPVRLGPRTTGVAQGAKIRATSPKSSPTRVEDNVFHLSFWDLPTNHAKQTKEKLTGQEVCAESLGSFVPAAP
jgi:hypothetical protein